MSNGRATCSLHRAENFSERQMSLADADRDMGTSAGVPERGPHLTDFPV